ncbi:MBL fold metallo-hydrolase [Glaciibacter superstes]|uniref:MBL fold metallo-hydrolase n=1 Tax=Glaciibacter superstes TaxID=501023 RepID=UPI0003B6E823|nr:MBL fold metallo-hydrolase [Glaciibacter superstes]
MTAVSLSDAVWLVGTADRSSPAFTSAFDCCQYLVWDGNDGFLVDAGTGLGAGAWLANIDDVARPEQLTGLLVTHYHGDHAGGVAAATAHGLRAYAGDLTASALRAGDETVTQLARARAAGIYPADYALEPVATIHSIDDFQSLRVGSLRVTAISAPGHCDGHFVFYTEIGSRRALFSGDVIFSEGRVSIQALPDCRLDEYADTVIGLAELEVDQLFAGHGPPVLEKASGGIASAAASFARLVPPPNLLP